MTTNQSGASLSYPLQCSALRIGGYVIIQGFPCKVIKMTTSKTGKHGHAKVNLTGLDIFTGRKYDHIEASTHNVEVPNVNRTEFQLIDIGDDGFLSLMDINGEMKEDVKLPDGELGESIRRDFGDNKELSLTVQSAMNHEAVIAAKVLN